MSPAGPSLRRPWPRAGRPALFAAAIGVFVLAVVVRAHEAETAVSAAGQVVGQDLTERAERIMNGSCQDCHTVRRLQVQAMDAAGWRQTIATMVEKGATIAPDDIPVLVDYLVEHHGPMPDGPGKDIVLNTCTLCHELKRIRLGRRSEGEWEETLVTMLNEGAPLSEAQFPVVHAYLSRFFGVD